MNDYVIYTDSACDIAPSDLQKWGVKYSTLTFRFEGEDKEYSNEDMEIKDFYDRMRQGSVARTAAINIQTFKEGFEEELKKGNDILYIGFTSGLSTTYNSARVASEELAEEYTDRKIVVIDSLCASAGQGLLVHMAVKEKEQGKTLDEVAAYIKDVLPKICHWFTVEDLVYLKRGGRVSSTAALVGNMLGIKPVLHVDDEGKLVNVSKVRGRKATLKTLVDKYTELAEDVSGGTVFMCNADCSDDVEYIKNELEERHGVCVEYVADIGPVIGAHAGPGTIAIFFVGKER